MKRLISIVGPTAAGKSHILKHFTAEMMTKRTLAVYDRVLAQQVGADKPVGYIRA